MLVWLGAGRTDLIAPIGARLRLGSLLLSPMVLVELTFLHETGRIIEPARTVLRNLQAGLDLRLCEHPFREVAMAAETLSWTRDPFDRLIVAQAQATGGSLLTRDRRILQNFAGARWG